MILHQSKNSRTDSFYINALYSNGNLSAFDYSTHFHNCFEVIRADEGTFDIHANGMTETMRPGDYALIFPNEIHSFTFDGPFRLWVCMFSGDYVSAFRKHMANKFSTSLVFHPAEEVDRVCISFLRHHKKNDAKYQNKGGLYLLCSEYLRLVTVEERAPKERLLMNKLSDYVALHYTEPIDLKKISSDLGYDYYYLSHCFRSFFNTTFTGYLNLFRVERAADDLENTELSITEILERNGFSSIRNFYLIFKNVYGVSPNTYRKELLNSSDKKTSSPGK